MATKKKTSTDIVIAGKTYPLFYSYDSYAKARETHGADPDLLNPNVLADMIHHALDGKMSVEEVKTARPAMVPAIQAVKAAIVNLYYGDEVPDEAEFS